jgi:hypothetical protein
MTMWSSISKYISKGKKMIRNTLKPRLYDKKTYDIKPLEYAAGEKFSAQF